MVAELIRHERREYLVCLGIEALVIAVYLAGATFGGVRYEGSAFLRVAVLSCLYALMLHMYIGTAAFQREFMLGVTMGVTRRRMVVALETVNFLGILLLAAVPLLVRLAEEKISGTPIDIRYGALLNPLPVLCAAALLAAQEMLAHAMISRFGAKAYYVLLFIYPGIIIAYNKISSNPAAKAVVQDALRALLGLGRGYAVASLAGVYLALIGVCAVVSWNFLKKQAVREM